MSLAQAVLHRALYKALVSRSHTVTPSVTPEVQTSDWAEKNATPPPVSVWVTHKYCPGPDGVTRYALSNGWFIDGSDRVGHRTQGQKYGIFVPGGDPSGCAQCVGSADTLKAAMALTDKMRGVPQPEPSSKNPVAEKLRDLARALDAQISRKENPAIARQRLTRRRADIAASMARDAQRLREIQQALNALAEAHEGGYCPMVLRDVRTKTVVENILSEYVTCESARDRLTLQGITSQSDLDEARAWLKARLRGPTPEEKSARRIKEMEWELIGCKINGFFPTPRSIVEQMIEQADIRPGMSVLEPSAGKGDILDVLREQPVWKDLEVVRAIEINQKLRGILQLKGYYLAPEADFLQSTGWKVDRVLMNPPFEKGQDIDHVRHGYECLKPGGRLVAVMSEGSLQRSDRRSESFREWLLYIGWTWEPLPENAFNTAEAFRATGVKTRLVVIDKRQAPHE